MPLTPLRKPQRAKEPLRAMSFSSLKMSRPRSSDSERALQRIVSAREAADADTLHGLGLAEAKLSGSGGVMKVFASALRKAPQVP